MSGGVDSSVAALLLRDSGYEVTGCTLKLRADSDTAQGGCSTAKDIEDAAAVCKILGIPHIVLPLRELFYEKVVTYFANEYINGRTPNPCIECNKNIKFGAMLDYALAEGMDCIATGHYADVRFNEETGRYQLRRAASAKDQSYVLYTLTQRQLAHVMFPVAGMEKPALRQIAKEANLPVHQKPDSQDICFVEDGEHVNFLLREFGVKPKSGNIIDRSGNILGVHDGIHNYTVGQRKGLGGGFSEPMYVIGLDAKSNSVIVGGKGSEYSDSLVCGGVNFISIAELTGEMRAEVKIRYAAKPAPATIRPLGGGLIQAEFDTPQRAVTPGQSAVFYAGDTVVGGGVILR
jgi:tRNA-specific 2-thiouridylase